MAKLKRSIRNIRIIVLLVFLVLALVAIHPNPWANGLAIRNVVRNSSASIAGIESPTPNVPPMNRERVLMINNKPIDSEKDYFDFVNTLEVNRTFTIKTC